MSKKIACFLFTLAAAARMLPSVEAGLIGGPINRPSAMSYGLSAGTGTLVPLLKAEFEGWRVGEETGNTLTAAIKIRPKFGKIAPYGLLGAGARFAKLTLRFSEYDFFTFFGGGLHLFPIPILSLRFDVRYFAFAPEGRLRLTGGIFLHL